ncbi:hypothetical protein D1007_40984 [Hordeum vulgare]|nr:hypothetical protein D1007_40984 [Hordeum vulgare]
MIIMEFLGHCIAPLQEHWRPLWEFIDGRDLMRLHISGLTFDELDGALGALQGPSPEDLPWTRPPLYVCDNMEGRVAYMPAFDEWGLVGTHKGSPSQSRPRAKMTATRTRMRWKGRKTLAGFRRPTSIRPYTILRTMQPRMSGV